MTFLIAAVAAETEPTGPSFGLVLFVLLLIALLGGSWFWVWFREEKFKKCTRQINMPNNCSVMIRNSAESLPNDEVTLRCLVSAVSYLRQEIQLRERRTELKRDKQPPETAVNEERAQLLNDAGNIEMTGSEEAPNFFNTTT